jgi:putative ABC transport system permease protein
MNVFMIAARNFQHRWFASLLTTFSMALGVTCVVLVLSIAGLIRESFDRNSNVGYNLVIGPKGSRLDLILNSVFFLSRPVSTLPYSYYLEFLPASARRQAFDRMGGRFEEPDRDGVYYKFTGGGFVIPMCMGDYVGKFRMIATTPDYFNLMKHGMDNDQPYVFAQGRNFETETKENGFFEGVLGARAAAELRLKVGDSFHPTHGAEGELHSDGFKVVGILAPTGTPVDRGAFANIEGFYLMDGHVAPERDKDTGLELAGQSGSSIIPAPDQTKPLPIHQREVSSLLLKTEGFGGISLDQQINKSASVQAASPVGVIAGLLETFFRPAEWALLALTTLVCAVSAISILVSIYNSMNERTRDIAVMRALGASRDRVLLVILCEAILISLFGGILGWIVGHAIAAAASPIVEYRTGIRVGLFSINSVAEPFIIPGLILIGILAGLLPALMAYRTDVSRSLQS